jgi:hypothetical protein
MTPRTLLVIASLVVVSIDGRAQTISFGEASTAAERCAEVADNLKNAAGKTLALKLRLRYERWRRYSGTDAQLEATFLSENTCLAHSIEPAGCPELQKLVNDTKPGDTLGAKLRILFPAETTDMRDRYAEMFVKSYCPALTGPSTKASTEIYVFVEGPVDVDGFVPPEMMGVLESVKDLTNALFKRGAKQHILRAPTKARADLVVSVTGREADGDNRIVRARVVVQEHTFDFEGTHGDEEWDTAASRAANKIVEWIGENRGRIVEGRKGQ